MMRPIEPIDPALLNNLRALRANPAALSAYTPVQITDIKNLHQYAMCESLEYFAECVAKDFCKSHHDPMPARHHRLLLHWLNQMAIWDGTGNVGIKRLMITMPPGSAKSTFAARIFVAWMMMRNEFSECILCSASTKLVTEHSDRIQKLVMDYGEKFNVKLAGVRGDQLPAKDLWKVSNRSSLVAVSTGANLQGFRGDIIVCDDAVGGIEDMTDGGRETIWQWFDQNILGRLSDKMARMVIIMTRWSEDDLCGRILRMKDSDGQWTVISLPAIWEYEHPEPEYPYGMGRKLDETIEDDKARLRDERLLLWPAFHDFERYDEARAGAELKFQAQYQGNPVPDQGMLFQTDKIKQAKTVQPAMKMVRSWDFASSKRRGADFTASVKMQVDARGHYTILDRTKERLAPHEARAELMRLALSDGPNCHIAISKDPGQAGAWQAQDIVAALAGHNIEVYPQTGSKMDRAKPFASQVNGENVSVLKGDWNEDFLSELAAFPNGVHDDQVDSASQALGSLLLILPQPIQPRWSHFNGMAR